MTINRSSIKPVQIVEDGGPGVKPVQIVEEGGLPIQWEDTDAVRTHLDLVATTAPATATGRTEAQISGDKVTKGVDSVAAIIPVTTGTPQEVSDLIKAVGIAAAIASATFRIAEASRSHTPWEWIEEPAGPGERPAATIVAAPAGATGISMLWEDPSSEDFTYLRFRVKYSDNSYGPGAGEGWIGITQFGAYGDIGRAYIHAKNNKLFITQLELDWPDTWPVEVEWTLYANDADYRWHRTTFE